MMSKLSRMRTWPPFIFICAAAGAGAASQGLGRIFFFGVAASAGLLFIASVPTQSLVVLTVLSTFFTRITYSVGGFRVRPEQIVIAGLVLHIALHARPSSSADIATPLKRATAGLALYLVWCLGVTFLLAPDPSASISVLLWLGVDLALLIVLS